MASTEAIKALNEALTTCRAQYDRMIENADQVLENRRNEHYQTITGSETRVAALESQLETFEALENERMARETRKDLDVAIAEHQSVVIAANRVLQDAIIFHARGFAAAGVALEASFNAASSRILSGDA